MSDTPFYLTRLGRQFFERDVPEGVKALKVIAAAFTEVIALEKSPPEKSDPMERVADILELVLDPKARRFDLRSELRKLVEELEDDQKEWDAETLENVVRELRGLLEG